MVQPLSHLVLYMLLLLSQIKSHEFFFQTLQIKNGIHLLDILKVFNLTILLRKIILDDCEQLMFF